MSFPAPPPASEYFDDFRFLNGYDPNGFWRLYVIDHTTGGTGVIAGGWCLNVTAFASADSCQMGTITIPAGAPGTTAGVAAPYPSTLNVTGTSGLIQRAQLKLFGLTHTYPDDLDVIVQSPSGRSMWLSSDGGGNYDVTNLDVTFDMYGPDQVPDETLMGPGPYSPTDYEEGDRVPSPGPPLPYGYSLSNELPNGTWKLWVADDTGGDIGSISGWCLNFELYDPAGFRCSDGAHPLTIPTGAPNVSFGPASPYPWPISVQQDGLIVEKVVVHLWSLSHTYLDDLDVLVVGPQGQMAMLMSDAGGAWGVSEHFLAFDDDAAGVVPDNGPPPMGRVRPANFDGGDFDSFPAPAPAGPYGTSLSVFEGTDPKGTWSVYVQDDASSDIGSALQWCLEISPRFPAGEAANLVWRGTSKNSLQWDAAPNASTYDVLRGTPDQLPSLLISGEDSCIAGVDHRLIAEGLNLVPPPGSFYWYLVVGKSGNLRGPAGRALVGGGETARTADSGGFCAAP
jgi:subtilisin-like proprotein convertase family protein